jgi:hypothetical protein
MALHRVTWVAIIFAAFIVVISTIRWFFLYPDMSQFVLGVLIGAGIFAYAHAYEWMKLTDKYVTNLTKRLDSLVYSKK